MHSSKVMRAGTGNNNFFLFGLKKKFPHAHTDFQKSKNQNHVYFLTLPELYIISIHNNAN